MTSRVVAGKLPRQVAADASLDQKRKRARTMQVRALCDNNVAKPITAVVASDLIASHPPGPRQIAIAIKLDCLQIVRRARASRDRQALAGFRILDLKGASLGIKMPTA